MYVFRSLKRKKQVHSQGQSERGVGVGRKVAWIGPGHVLAMEGSIVWVNMFGELWKAASEQVREATTVENLGVEVVAEDFSEMQERLKRSSRRAGFRDVTADVEELDDRDVTADVEEDKERDEVAEEGMIRGQPRVRFDEQGYSPSIAPDEPDLIEPVPLSMPPPAVEEDVMDEPELGNLFIPDPTPQTHGRRVAPRLEERRASNATVEEPDEEQGLVE